MSLTKLNNYSCRNRNGGAPEVRAGVRAANNASLFKKGDVLAVSSGNLVAGTVASALITNATIVGFSDHTDGANLGYPSHFPMPPVVTNPDNGLNEILYYSGSQDNIHTLPLKSDQTPLITDVGLTYQLGYDATNGVFYVDKTSTTVPHATIVGIYPGELGVAGGRVDFVIKAAAYAYA